MRPDVTATLADAETWYLLARLFERPTAHWKHEAAALAGEALDGNLGRAARLATDADEGRYFEAFGPSGVVSPREVAHCGMRDPGQLLAELRTCYDAFGYHPAHPDTIDHVAVETDFVAFLRLKEAYAAANDEAEHAAIAGEAAASFIDDHLRVMGEPIARALAEHGQSYLVAAANVLRDRVGPAPETARSRVIWMRDEEDAMECGG